MPERDAAQRKADLEWLYRNEPSADDRTRAMDEAEAGFIFIPLGGSGEIGMNLNLYGCDGSWLAVDCGMGFSGPENPDHPGLGGEISQDARRE